MTDDISFSGLTTGNIASRLTFCELLGQDGMTQPCRFSVWKGIREKDPSFTKVGWFTASSLFWSCRSVLLFRFLICKRVNLAAHLLDLAVSLAILLPLKLASYMLHLRHQASFPLLLVHAIYAMLSEPYLQWFLLHRNLKWRSLSTPPATTLLLRGQPALMSTGRDTIVHGLVCSSIYGHADLVYALWGIQALS